MSTARLALRRFPQPWLPTRAYAHPFSGLPYKAEEEWSLANYNSCADASSRAPPHRSSGRAHTRERACPRYSHVADFFWHSMLPITNHLRVNMLNLKTLRFGAFGGSLLTSCHVPFVKMWSPALCPKPSDWPAHVDVVGAFFQEPNKSAVDETEPEKASAPALPSLRCAALPCPALAARRCPRCAAPRQLTAALLGCAGQAARVAGGGAAANLHRLRLDGLRRRQGGRGIAHTA
jgi:hypothetical protein